MDALTAYRQIRLPGLIDIHVHVREPGAIHKEDWTSCTKAGIAGGITMILAMPNTNPIIQDRDSYNLVCNLAKAKAYCDYGINLCATTKNMNTAHELVNLVTGLKMYLNSTYGDMKLESMQVWAEHIKNWDDTLSPILVHAEGQTLGAVLHICHMYGKRVHVCHVSRKEEIGLIKLSKSLGQQVTCEVSPHHLFLTEEDGNNLGAFGEVRPNLATQQDQQALWDNLDIIDCFATDHAPHTVQEKECEGCPGFAGLETALALLLTAVRERKLTIDDIISKYHGGSKRFLTYLISWILI